MQGGGGMSSVILCAGVESGRFLWRVAGPGVASICFQGQGLEKVSFHVRGW